MKLQRSVVVFAMSLFAMGCSPDNFGLALGDLSGIWIASEYEFIGAQATVDVVSRDGASMTMSIDDGAPPTVATTFLDGMGSSTTGAGIVDIVEGTLAIGTDTFDVEHSGNLMTLTKAAAMFDFGSGTVSATLRIRLSRL